MKFKKLILLAGFGLFAAQMPLLQASELQIPEENKQNSEEKSTQNLFVDTAPVSIMKWSGAIACVIVCGASIYYMPSILKNLNDASEKLKNQTVTAWTQAGIAVEKDTGFIVKIVDDFAAWLKSFLKDPLTFNLNTKESTLQKLDFNLHQKKRPLYIKWPLFCCKIL
jgi:hypothetical protein